MDNAVEVRMLHHKNELTPIEKVTIRGSKEPTVITTANGKGESTEETTVYVNDLEVFVAIVPLENSPAVLSPGLFCTDLRCSCEWKKGESPSLMKDENVTRCKSENHVPLLAVAEEPRIPDAPSKASGDRLRIPGGRSSGDQSREVLQSDVPGLENAGQASGDRWHSQVSRHGWPVAQGS